MNRILAHRGLDILPIVKRIIACLASLPADKWLVRKCILHRLREDAFPVFLKHGARVESGVCWR